MRNVILAGFACAALMAVAAPASAEDTTVVHRNSGPAVAVEHREGVVEGCVPGRGVASAWPPRSLAGAGLIMLPGWAG